MMVILKIEIYSLVSSSAGLFLQKCYELSKSIFCKQIESYDYNPFLPVM